MNSFAYAAAPTVAQAISTRAALPTSSFIAGGTNLLDLMKERVARPTALIDLAPLPLRHISSTPAGGLLLGALVTNSETAYDASVVQRYPLLSKAILAGASAQLRNMATNGGNLMQRTRCAYFYDGQAPCNKREPGTGCAAIGGISRNHAILGGSEHCIATYPSDMATALAALEARVHVQGPEGSRTIDLADFHRLPEHAPERDNTLRAPELILAIELPPEGFADHYAYLKVRDRSSYAFALVAVAVGLTLADGRITAARLALGSVAAKPWRDPAAEALLIGQLPTAEVFRQAAEHLLYGATSTGQNDFKIELAKRAIVRAGLLATAQTPAA
ncbi:MAG: FAD binding domain-containing protein [Janthinobacterium lividum]